MEATKKDKALIGQKVLIKSNLGGTPHFYPKTISSVRMMEDHRQPGSFYTVFTMKEDEEENLPGVYEEYHFYTKSQILAMLEE